MKVLAVVTTRSIYHHRNVWAPPSPWPLVCALALAQPFFLIPPTSVGFLLFLPHIWYSPGPSPRRPGCLDPQKCPVWWHTWGHQHPVLWDPVPCWDRGIIIGCLWVLEGLPIFIFNRGRSGGGCSSSPLSRSISVLQLVCGNDWDSSISFKPLPCCGRCSSNCRPSALCIGSTARTSGILFALLQWVHPWTTQNLYQGVLAAPDWCWHVLIWIPGWWKSLQGRHCTFLLRFFALHMFSSSSHTA